MNFTDRTSDGSKYICMRCSNPACRNEECLNPSQDGVLAKVKKALNGVFRPVMKSSHYDTLPPAESTFCQRLKYDLLLPPTGMVSHLVTIALLAVLGWAALWSVLRGQMLYHGNILGLYMILLVGLAAGWLVERFRLAPLLGEFITVT